MKNNGSNDGLQNDFYKIKEWVVDVDDLAESINLDGYQFNILKSLFGLNIARHNGTSPMRDSNKMIHYSIKNKMKLLRKDNPDITRADILYEIYSKMSVAEKRHFMKLTKRK